MLIELLSIFGTYTEGVDGAQATYVVNYFVALGVAAAIIFIGQAMVRHSAFLRKAGLPAAVVSGLLFAVIMCFVKVYSPVVVTFDAATLKDLSQNIFFAGIGFAFNVAMLKKAGRKLVINIAIGAVLIITLQNILGIALSYAIGLNPLLGLQCSSASMSGGVATAAAMGPFYESLGAANATEVGVAAGTMGNVLASLIGGPIGALLIKTKGLKGDPNDKPAVNEENPHQLNTNTVLRALCMILVLAFIAKPITWLFGLISINMPVCISCIFGGAIVRIIYDHLGKECPTEEIETLSNNWLQVYLALVMMTVDFTKLAPLAGQVAIILIAQLILMFFFAWFVSYNLFGGRSENPVDRYGAAIMTAGNVGWSIGSATNCVANEKALMDEYGWHSTSWNLYPSWSVIMDDLYNPVVLSILGNVFAAV